MDRQFGFRKTRFLCLHGFRSSGKILQTELKQWPDFVLGKMDLVFVDAPFPAEGKSGHEGKFDPPYYEWFQSNEGALLSAVLPGMQAQGVALTRVLKINFVIVISGGKFGGSKFSSPKLAENAFSSPIECPSLHIYGEDDFAKPNAIELLDSFVIHHHEDEKDLEVMLSFIEKIQGGGRELREKKWKRMLLDDAIAGEVDESYLPERLLPGQMPDDFYAFSFVRLFFLKSF